jgi:hypothetical protein
VQQGLGGAVLDRQFTYQDFDLLIEPGLQGHYRARVLRSPAGESKPVQFIIPFSPIELENFVLRLGRPRRGTRGRPESAPLKDFGGKLYGAVFQDELRDVLLRSLNQIRAEGAGMRLRLRLTDTPELADLPWEFLYDQRLNRFLAQSPSTPLVRYLDLPDPPRPLRVDGPLRLLAMISSPSDGAWLPLDVEREWSLLDDALGRPQEEGLVIIERLAANMGALRRRLRRDEFHVFHFVGHGRYRQDWRDGVLVMEDPSGRPHEVPGEELGGLLSESGQTRLAVLNACEGARTDASDPFAGVAQSLIQQGLPAVVAMQFEITDDAAIVFARELYGAIGDGYPVEAALAEARGAIRDEGNPTEWGTPVLYSRALDGRLFDLTHQSRISEADSQAPEEADRKIQEEDADRKGQAASSKPTLRRSYRPYPFKVPPSLSDLDGRINRLTSSPSPSYPGSGERRSLDAAFSEVIKDEARTLAEFLDRIDHDVRLLDANLEEVHGFVEVIRRFAKKYVLDSSRPSNYGKGVQEACIDLDNARDIENDLYELYADGLERYDEGGTDLDVVIERRRKYISGLQEFQRYLSAVVACLRSPRLRKG